MLKIQVEICITLIRTECVSSRRLSLSHTQIFISIVPLSSVAGTQTVAYSKLLTGTHAVNLIFTSFCILCHWAPPCPAHMIAPFPGPLLPAFTPFPWQLSFKWVEPLISARLVKTSFAKSDTGNQLHAITMLLTSLLGVPAVSPQTGEHTPTVRPLRRTVHGNTHTEEYLEPFVKTHPQWDSCCDWHWDRLPKGAQEMFFGKLMRCGDRGVIFYSPRVAVRWYMFKGNFLFHVCLTLLRDPCVFDGPCAGHFLPTAGAVQSFISYLHKRPGRTRGCEAGGQPRVNVNVLMCVRYRNISTSSCVFSSSVRACLFFSARVRARTYVCH